MKKLISLVMIFAAVMAVSVPSTGAQYWSQLTFSPQNVTLAVGETQTVSVYGAGGDALNVTYNSNTNVAQVTVSGNDSVSVHAINVGSAVVTVSTYQGSGTFYVTVTQSTDQNNLRFVTTTLPNAVVNEYYSQRIQVTGGDSPYRYTVSSGTLPDRMTLSEDGWIRGTPRYAETYNFGIRVRDEDGAQITRTFSIRVMYGDLGGEQERYRFRHGQLVNENGTIYSLYRDQKTGFVNMEAFTGLGYRLSNVDRGVWLGNVPETNYVISNPNTQHPWGTWVISGQTVYFVHEDGLIPITTYDIFINNNGQDRMLVQMNWRDREVRQLSFMTYNDERLQIRDRDRDRDGTSYDRVVDVGDTFIISLEANPSTGYQWEISYDSYYLRLVDRTFEPYTDLLGSGGIEEFEFKALNRGSTVIDFDYARPWESGPPLYERSYYIHIQ